VHTEDSFGGHTLELAQVFEDILVPLGRPAVYGLPLGHGQRLATAPQFGSTKLNKVLFQADFTAYRRRGDSITAFEYQALERGPTLRKMKPVLRGLKNSNAVAIERHSVGDNMSP